MKQHLAGITALVVMGVQPSTTLAAAKPHRHHAPRVSIANASVMEWFARPTAAAGSMDIVFIHAWVHNAPLAGARLHVDVMQGKRVLVRVNGGQTDRQGRVQARFGVPRVHRGVRLTVRVALRTRRLAVFGANQLQVR